LRVAAYYRVSSDEQALKGNSLFEQQERLSSYCKAMGWEPPTFYEDDGYSGKDLNRPAITRLLEDIKSKNYDMVLTTKSDRLCRKLLDLLSLVEYFKKYECNYTSSTEHFDTSTPTGMLALQILGSFAEFERERIRERVKENHMSLARQGKMIGKAAYGYNIVDGSYEINIEESLVVHNIFQWFLEGMGSRHIAKKLNDMGVPSKNGVRWDERRIRYLLSLETLVGKFIYNRTYRKGSKDLIRPQDEWIIIDDHHEPVIDLSTFEQVQDVLGGRLKKARKYASDDKYLLSGLTYCGHCGEKMHGRTFHNKNIKYVCSEYVKRAGCYFHYIYRDDLENVIIQAVIELLNPVEKPSKIFLIVNNENKHRSLDQRKLLEEQLEKISARMQKQIAGWEKELISDDDLKIAKIRLENERISVLKSIDQLENTENTSDEFKVKEKVKALESELLSGDRLRIKSALCQVVNKIIITDGENVQIVWEI
jgi:site-specific DNA recombinase